MRLISLVSRFKIPAIPSWPFDRARYSSGGSGMQGGTVEQQGMTVAVSEAQLNGAPPELTFAITDKQIQVMGRELQFLICQTDRRHIEMRRVRIS